MYSIVTGLFLFNSLETSLEIAYMSLLLIFLFGTRLAPVGPGADFSLEELALSALDYRRSATKSGLAKQRGKGAKARSINKRNPWFVGHSRRR